MSDDELKRASAVDTSALDEVSAQGDAGALGDDAADESISEEEAREAAALAEVLEGRSVHLSQDVLEAVGLLRLAENDELSLESASKIEAELLSRHRPLEVNARRSAWWWVLLAGLGPAGVVVVLFVRTEPDRREAALASRQLPVPELSVIEAQASWLASDAERPSFEREMQTYRNQVLAALEPR
jgi:hypothetical protein